MHKQDSQQYLSIKMADSVMARPSKYMDKWCYEFGLILKALQGVWEKTGDIRFFKYIKENIDRFIDAEGNIKDYDPEELNLDHINPGKILLLLYNETSDDRYKKAAHILRNQLDKQPRNLQGGFWHKQIYPHQMWLDGVYMSSPFYAQYALMFDEPYVFDDIANQVLLLAENAHDPKTGLMYHGWDESRGMKWANDKTGCSPHFWGRALGWYAMALVDILNYFPKSHVKKEKLVEVLQRLLKSLIAVQDSASGVWYQIVDMGGRKGNYLEASASCMFTYAISKSLLAGYLDASWKADVQRAYRGIIEHFTYIDEKGFINLKNVCSVAGLGGNPYRDGSFSYYINEPVTENDYKGYGPLILAGVQLETLEEQ